MFRPGRRTIVFAGGAAVLLLALGAFALTGVASPEPLSADAGPDRTVECSSPQGAAVALDATGSRPGTNGTISSYAWYAGYNTSAQARVASGATASVVLPLGEHRLTLVVTGARPETANATADGTSNGTANGSIFPVANRTANATIVETAVDEVVVRVVDTTAPTISAVASAPSLWPPNHRMRDVDVSVVAHDACGAVSWRLASAGSDEADDGRGDGRTAGDLEGADVGTQDTSFRVRAERAGPGDGRAYRFVYVATDASGNSAESAAVVAVPHDG